MDYKYSSEIMKEQLNSKHICPEIKYAFEASIEAMEKHLGNGWIAVSERLPTKDEYNKNDGRFIVTDGNRVYQSLFDIYSDDTCFIDVIYKGNCNLKTVIDKRVIAWQPLPEPYKL